MAFPTITVLDGTGAAQTRNTLPDAGQQDNVDSLPVALSTEQQAILSAIVTALTSPVEVDGTVAVTSTALTDIELNTEAVKPAGGAFAVTPDDVTNFGTATRGLYVGGAGNVVAIIGGVAITFTAVPAGTVLPIIATRVNSASTTATAMVGLT